MLPVGSVQSAPLPPLPDLPKGGSGQGAGQAGSGMADLMSGLGPVKTAVDTILQAVKTIIQSGAVPGAEQVGAQIIALAASLLPMAAQQAMAPGGIQPIGPAQPQGQPQGQTGPPAPMGGAPQGGQ